MKIDKQSDTIELVLNNGTPGTPGTPDEFAGPRPTTPIVPSKSCDTLTSTSHRTRSFETLVTLRWFRWDKRVANMDGLDTTSESINAWKILVHLCLL